MKKAILLTGAMAICALTSSIFAQNVELKKEVRMEEENGVKTLTILTTENGNVTEEVYTGQEAETKLAEEMEGRGLEEGVKKEIEVEEIDGVLTLTIITSNKGKIRKEVYTGVDAEKKLQDLENGETDSSGSRTIIKEVEEVND
ncbi:MAG: hypothetical protein QNK23_01310 [Crocinitomicaceae bacterium]|nr:hypothetical protein [Crocinitomicaceae bacterium]